MLAPWRKSYDQPRQHIKKQRHYFTDKCPYSQNYGFSSDHVWIWELDHKESWAPKNWLFFFFLSFFFFKFYFIFKLYITVLVLPNIKMNPPQVWTVVLEKIPESPLESKEIKSVNTKGNQSWIFIGRLMLKLKLQYFVHLMQRIDSLEKTLMLGKI